MIRHPFATVSPLDVLFAVAIVICLLVAVYFMGKAAERRQRRNAGRKLRLRVPPPGKRFEPFLAPRRALRIDLSQSSPLGQSVFIDRPL